MLPSPSGGSQLLPGQHSQHAAKMPLCPANPVVICWFLTLLNESPWWPQNLSHHRRLTGYRWLAGLYAHPWGNTCMRSRWGVQAPGHSHTAGLEQWGFPQGNHGDRRNTAPCKWLNPPWELSPEYQCLGQHLPPAHLAVIACKNSLDLIRQPLPSRLQSLLFLVCRNNSISLFFLMAKFPASLMGIMSMRKYLSDAGITAYVLVAVLTHCKLLYLVQLFGVWCYCRHTEDSYPDFWRPRMLTGLFTLIGFVNIKNISA